MPERFRRIIHQQAQVSSFEALYSNLESLTIVLLSKYIEQQLSSPWYSANCCRKMLLLSDLVTMKATSHSTIFDIPMRPLRDQKHRHRFTR